MGWVNYSDDPYAEEILMKQLTVMSKDAAKIWMEDQEVCREYYKTDKITFGMSELPPGGVGAVDPGHSKAHEVFYCVRGEVLCYVSQDDTYYRLKAGDAMLVRTARTINCSISAKPKLF